MCDRSEQEGDGQIDSNTLRFGTPDRMSPIVKKTAIPRKSIEIKIAADLLGVKILLRFSGDVFLKNLLTGGEGNFRRDGPSRSLMTSRII